MQYVVRKGYSYTDIHGRNLVYRAGEEFSGKIDETQKWKLGVLEQAVEVPIATKGVDHVSAQTKKAKTEKELDDEEMDKGEE